MEPQTVKKLTSDVPEIKEFIDFIKKQVRNLDRVSDIKLEDPIEKSIEVSARQRSIETLVGILTPLINTQSLTVSDNNEFVV